MKSTFYFILLSISTISVSAQTNLPFMNHIAIAKTGVCVSFTDGQHSTNDVEVFADAPLHWILENQTNRAGRLVHQAPQNQFFLQLTDSQGREVPLTDYGKWMNTGPHQWGPTESIHAYLLSPYEISDRDFPKLTELFRISQPGEFILEARYWYLPAHSNGWQMSDPIRLKVINRAKLAGQVETQGMTIPINTIWTNSIAIGDFGILMSLTDSKLETPEDWTNGVFDTEVPADAPLRWIYQNSTDKVVRLEDDGIQHSYDLKLFEASGGQVALTEYGKWMNSGPRSPITGTVQVMELLPNNRMVKEFPAIENFFDLPHNGKYILEARRIYLDGTDDKWHLTEPVRLKVTK